ncbi:MAG: ABC transporter ATP-binding protein/permease [Roseburia sp.]|nr:ABC transporter ATP-binding protein/permease [Roseburia sp.]
MNKKISANTVRLVFGICKKDCVIMILVQLILSVFPMVVALMNRRLINKLELREPLISIMISVIAYTLAYHAQKIIQIYYYHYFVTYRSMPEFEKQIKKNLFGYAEGMRLSDFDKSEIVNGALRAKNASVNLFRIFQAYVEMLGAIVSCLFIGLAGIFIDWRLSVFILMIAASALGENVCKVRVEEKDFYARTQLEKEYDADIHVMTAPKAFKEVKVMDRFEFVYGKWREAAQRVSGEKRKKNRDILRISALFGGMTYLLTIAAYIMIFMCYKNNTLSASAVSFGLISFISITDMIEGIFDVGGMLSQFIVMVMPYYEYRRFGINAPERGRLEEKPADIRLTDVSYRYHNQNKDAVSGVNLSIGKGEKVVLVGENGSGKSTLIRLICGLLEPQEGQVLYNNADGRNILECALLREMTCVPQNMNCYAVSLRENITFAGEIDDKALGLEMERLNISTLRDRLDKVVGAEFGGTELSGGEKQKVAILRAMIKDADIVLLDEPTSAIDPMQEGEIYDRLDAILENKTGIIVSHRLSFAKNADKIYVLDKGRIVESGTHGELLGKDGIYRKLWRAQAGGYAL